jgi:hypothetical protein
VYFLLLDLRIFRQHLAHISHDIINFADIKMTDGKMCFDAPMRLLSEISHNIHTELVVRNMKLPGHHL